MVKKHIFQSFITAAVIIGITTALFLYAAGFRLEKKENKVVDVTRTGIIGIKSIPQGASVYLDEELVTATDDTIAGVEPGIHELRIVKKGFVEWEKEVEVFPELVTDITAVLISQTPRLEPLTNTGARYPIISPSLDKLAYFSNDSDKPGVWVIPFSTTGLSLFRTNATVVLEDSRTTKYSQGTAITWSPSEKNLLVQGSNGSYYLIDRTTNTTQSVYNPEDILAAWRDEKSTKRIAFIEKLDVPEEIKEKAIAPDSIWSPDEKKFLYIVDNGDTREYRIYNMEKPIPIGENVETVVFTTEVNEKQPKITWYSDSFHLILTEWSEESNTGVINLIRIDGTNKIEVYNNTLYSDHVYSGPGGDKLIILTSFKSGEQTDLYTVGIR